MAAIEVVIGEPEVRALLERAADALHGDDALGARVRARLSTALSLGAPISARAELASEARRRALASGDPVAIAEALAAWCDVVAGPDHLDERRSAAAEIVQHATATGDLRREALGCTRRSGAEVVPLEASQDGAVANRSLQRHVPAPLTTAEPEAWPVSVSTVRRRW